MRAIFEQQRERFGAVARIEDGHTRSERHFGSVRFESFAIELDGAAHIVVDHVEFQVGVLQHVWNGRRI